MERPEISLRRLFHILIKRIVPILLVTIIAAGIGYAAREFFVDTLYTSSAKLYVNTNNSNSSYQTSDLNDYNYRQKVVSTYIQFLTTNSFNSKVSKTLEQKHKVNSEALDNIYTPSQIASMVKMTVENETEVFRVSVTSTSPKDAKVIAQTIIDLAPETIEQMREKDTVKTVDEPTQARVSNNNYNLYALFSALVGFVLTYFVFLFVDFADVRIHDEDDFSKIYEIPVLGIIPDFSSEAANKKSYGKNKSRNGANAAPKMYGDFVTKNGGTKNEK